MVITVVDSGSRLRVSYTLLRAANSQGNFVVVLHHGICHSREQFLELAAALNALGFHVAITDQQSERAGFFVRNFIGLKQYVAGMKAAATRIEQEEGLRIGCYVLHSMGALIGEMMQQANPELRRPTVMMAPIPIHGAIWITIRLALTRPLAYLRAVATLSIRSLAGTPKHVRKVFFDEQTPQHLVDRTTEQIRHAPFRVYLQLALRGWWGPSIQNDDQPKLLLISSTDGIFHPSEYEETIELFEPHTHELSVGGHDFFIQFADETAERIELFMDQHVEQDVEQPATGSAVPAPHIPLQPSAPQPARQPVAMRRIDAPSKRPLWRRVAQWFWRVRKLVAPAIFAVCALA